MRPLIVTVLGILRLRDGPEDLPASVTLTVLAYAAYAVLGMYLSSLAGSEDTAPRMFVVLGVQLLAVVAMLRIRGVPERLAQTLLALAGTGIVLSALFAPVVLSLDPDQPGRPGPVLAWLGLTAWSLMVDGHIYRRALNSALGVGIVIAVGLYVINLYLTEWLF